MSQKKPNVVKSAEDPGMVEEVYGNVVENGKSTDKPKEEPADGEFKPGDIVEFSATAERFVSGKAIPESARTNELYVSRVNRNGTVVVGYSDSYTEIDATFPYDLTNTGKVREHADKEWECPDVSIRIFGVPSRMENIETNKKRLHVPDECIFIDEDYDGVIPTAKRAWLHPTDKPYVLVLQDDVELCDNFAKYVNAIIKAQPDAIISLFITQLTTPNSLNRVPTDSPYVRVPYVSGQGIIMPTKYVKECIDSWQPNNPGDDTNITKWANDNDIPVITTIPMILQHIGDESVFDPSRTMGRSVFYSKRPRGVHWDNPYATSYYNIVRT